MFELCPVADRGGDVQGGREARNLDAVRLCELCERLGAGEILLNSIDCDGQKKGFDVDFVRWVNRETGDG